MKHKRKILCLALAMLLVFCYVGTASAAVSSATIGVKRISNTSGKVTVAVNFNRTASSCSAKIVLQEKYNGSWRTATGVPVSTVIFKDKNVSHIFEGYTFTLRSGKVYRPKVTITDTRNSSSSSVTYYGASF